MSMSESECLRRIVRKAMRAKLGTEWAKVNDYERRVVAGAAVVQACGVRVDLAAFRMRAANSTYRDCLRIGDAVTSYFLPLTGQGYAVNVARFVSVALALEYMERKAEARIEEAVSPHLPGGHVGRLSCNVGPSWVLFPLRHHRLKHVVETWTEGAFDWWIGGAPGKGSDAPSRERVHADFGAELERFGRVIGELDGE